MLFSFQVKRFRPFRFLNLHGVGAEIGVYRGDFSVILLDMWQVQRLYLIDPYEYFGEEQKLSQNDLDRAKAKSARRTRKYGYKARWLRFESHWAAPLVQEPLDFCYIDGDHDYAAVKQDIADYWPKLKKGGILGGHDFHYTWPGVIRAVTEFTVNNRLQLHVESPDWWVYKPDDFKPD